MLKADRGRLAGAEVEPETSQLEREVQAVVPSMSPAAVSADTEQPSSSGLQVNWLHSLLC